MFEGFPVAADAPVIVLELKCLRAYVMIASNVLFAAARVDRLDSVKARRVV